MLQKIILVMFTGLIFASGCEQNSAVPTSREVTPENVRRDAGQASQTAAEYSQQSKEEFQKALDSRLKELDAQIAKLREKGRDLKDQAKTDWDQKMADLESKRETARVKLAEIGHSSAEAWNDVRQGAQSAWDELDKAFRDASREF